MGMVSADYDSDTPHTTWVVVVKMMLKGRKEPLFKIGDVVQYQHGTVYDRRLKLKVTSSRKKRTWEYKVVDTGSGNDFSESWIKESALREADASSTLARCRVGDIVRGPDWETKLKVEEVQQQGALWTYKLTSVEDEKVYVYDNREWLNEKELYPFS